MELEAVKTAIETHGYWALFVGTFMEGETFFLLGGIAARKGLLNPYYVALTALLGGFIGDQVFFFLGKWRGRWLMERSRRVARKADEAQRLIQRHAVPLMLLSRFLYGLRMVIPLACGTAHIPAARFMLLNFISALLWTCTFGGLGYWFGGWIFAKLDTMRNIQSLLLVILVVMVATLLVGHYIRRKLGQNGDDAPVPPPNPTGGE